MQKLKQALGAAILAATTLAAGCAGSVRAGYVSGYAVTAPPPADVYEVRGPAPYYEAVWVPGYWNYDNGQYVWRRGHYTHARAGYQWVPHRWVRDGRGYRLSQGYWRPYDRSYYR